MHTSRVAEVRSRRAVLAAAASAGGAALLAGCGGKPLREKIRSGARLVPGDVAALNALLDVEHYGIAAYAATIPLLGHGGQAAGTQFLSQELAHVVELTELVKRAGGKANKPASSYDLGHPRTAPEGLALLERVERGQLAAYLEMIPRLSDGHARSALATMFANDAQHLAVIRSQQSKQPVATAFATG